MKKVSLLIFIFFLVLKTSAQLVAVLQLPPSGLTYKPQLWNMVLSNTSNFPLTLHIELSITPVNSSSQVLTAVTKTIVLKPGMTQINASNLVPIQYNVLNNAYSVDANPMGFLPIGQFEACYHFFRHVPEDISQIVEQCQDIIIGPMNPPQLVYPYNQTGIEELHPQFSWLPPVPVTMFTNLSYDLRLVAIQSGQSAADAIQQNAPLYQSSNISAINLLYPLSAPTLEYDKHYAWGITAKNNGNNVATTDTWEFWVKHFGVLPDNESTEQPYIELKKDPENAYAVFINEIKFSYTNETSDASWNIKVFDLSANRSQSTIPLDTIPLKRGQNLVRYNAISNSFFVEKHLYQMEITNSRNEIWRLRFEYRKPENNQ